MKSLTVLLFLLSMMGSVQLQAANECLDVEGVRHKEGEGYIGPDKCNDCKCINGRNACTKKSCSPDLKRESAEAGLCVDNMGNRQEVGKSYTHVDGCNTCQCTDNGGACTKKMCLPELQRTGGMCTLCMDQSGAKKNPDETWMARDGCNHCICSIFGPICTKKMCSALEKTQKTVQSDQLCGLTNGTRVAAGATWLTADSCNVCTCSGETGMFSCTEESCRYRLHRFKDPQFKYSGAEHLYTPFLLLVLASLGLMTL